MNKDEFWRRVQSSSDFREEIVRFFQGDSLTDPSLRKEFLNLLEELREFYRMFIAPVVAIEQRQPTRDELTKRVESLESVIGKMFGVMEQ